MRRFKFFMTCLVWAALLSAALSPPAAMADIFYTVSNYGSGSLGVILSENNDPTALTVRENLVNNLGRDAAGFTFMIGTTPVGLIREYNYGPDDRVMLYGLGGLAGGGSFPTAPLLNSAAWKTSNIHAVRSCSANGYYYLYAGTYESYGDSAPSSELAGEVVRTVTYGSWPVEERVKFNIFSKDGKNWYPHNEGIWYIANQRKPDQSQADYVYALWSISVAGALTYQPSQIWQMTPDLQTVVKKAEAGKNIGQTMGGNNAAFYNGKLYVAAGGGWQGPGTWGNLYEVNLYTMKSRKVLDGYDIVIWKDAAQTQRSAVGIYSIAIAVDGTAFILAGSYDGNFEVGYDSFFSGIWRTTVEELRKGNPGTKIASFTDAGFSWSLAYDKTLDAFWAMTGKNLRLYGKDGNHIRTFEPNELGDNIYSVSVIGDGGHIEWDDAWNVDDAIESDPGANPRGGETLSEVLGGAEASSSRAYSPMELSLEEKTALSAAALANGGAETLSSIAGATVTGGRRAAANLTGSYGNSVHSLFVSAGVEAGGLAVFRPSFTFGSDSDTPSDNLMVDIPETAAEFDAGFVFRIAFQNGSYVDIGTGDYDGEVLQFNAGGPEITTVPEVVVVDGYAQGGDLLWGDDEGHAGFALRSAGGGYAGLAMQGGDGGDYLVMYDGVPDGTAEAAFAVLKTGGGGGGNNDGGGSGGGCASGAYLFALMALPLAVISVKRKGKCGK